MAADDLSDVLVLSRKCNTHFLRINQCHLTVQKVLA